VFQKFANKINHSLRKIRTAHNVVFPPPCQDDPQRRTQDETYTSTPEHVLNWFTSLVLRAVDQLAKWTPDSPGPLAGVELWWLRSIILSSLRE
jgi:hypothetical protein